MLARIKLYVYPWQRKRALLNILEAQRKSDFDSLKEDEQRLYREALLKQKDEEWIALEQREGETGTMYDKYIITIASGGFAFSMSALKLIEGMSVKDTSYLKATWFFLALSVALIVCSFLLGQWALRRQSKLNDAYFDDPARGERPKNILTAITLGARVLSGVALAIGFFCFMWFANSNVDQYLKMKEKSKEGNARAAESVSPVFKNKPPIPQISNASEETIKTRNANGKQRTGSGTLNAAGSEQTAANESTQSAE